MKTLLKTLLLCAALAVMNGCSAQKRAERHLRKAVSLCPEMVQVKAHPIDTVLTVGPWADFTYAPMPKEGETVYAATNHGTVVVSLRQSDSALRVGFVAAPQEIHYRDTIRYAQVSVEAKPQSTARVGFWKSAVFVLAGVILGFATLLALALLGKPK